MRQRNLPPRMYAHGASYRYAPKVGAKVNLGSDLDDALRRYYLLIQPAPPFDPREESLASRMWHRHRKGAKQRGIEYLITSDDIARKMAEQSYRCAVTCLPFSDEKPHGVRIRPWLPSVDRINSRASYTPGNIRIVCAFVNVAMNGFGDEFFKAVLGPLIDAAVKAELHKLGH